MADVDEPTRQALIEALYDTCIDVRHRCAKAVDALLPVIARYGDQREREGQQQAALNIHTHQPTEWVEKQARLWLDFAANIAIGECPLLCDDDCDEPCHEVHVITRKRTHQPENCPGRFTRGAEPEQEPTNGT